MPHLNSYSRRIYHSKGKLLGVVNLSSFQQNYNPLILGLVKRAAHSIEQALLLEQIQKQSKNAMEDLNFVYDYPPSPLITLHHLSFNQSFD